MHPEEFFNNLFSLLTYELLWYAFRKLKRDKAPGADGVTVDQYEEHLRENLQDLLARLHRGAYQPQPSLRCDIPKGDGRAPTRSVGRRPPTNEYVGARSLPWKTRSGHRRAALVACGGDDSGTNLRSGLL